MIVFPESMNTLPKGRTKESLSTMESYINYMKQRVEWAMGNVVKSVSSAGTSSAELYILLTALQNTVSALQSTVNSHGASISAMLQTITGIENDLASLQSSMTAMQERVATLETSCTALERRVTALEAKEA